jgi:autotransporter-associated beta strand protein
VVLGATNVDTTGTINQVTTGTFSGVIGQFSGRTGSVTKIGAAMLTLSGTNTYTGDTTVNAGTLALASTGELMFLVRNGNVANRILGTGAVTLDGTLRLNVSNVTDTVGTWNLVNVSTLGETFGSTFGLKLTDNTTFSNDGGGSYSSGNWSFSTATGNLTLIPEPGSAALLLGAGALLLARRRRP